MIALQAITIDDQRTLDMDDAIWVERGEDHWKIVVAIADAAPAVALGSRVDERAQELVATRYFATETLPMLPRHFADKALSLWPGESRQVIAIEIKLTPALEIVDCRPYLTTLKSGAKLAYNDIPALLVTSDSPWNSMLVNAYDVAIGLLEKRRSLGAMALYDLNHGWATTEEGHIRQLTTHEMTVGYIIVQELMILANGALAEYAVKRNIPVMFRNHIASSAAPDRAALIQQLNSALSTPIEGLSALRQRTHLLLSRATYGSSLLGHYGLNLPAYLHFTSPIRRFPDLVNHRQIRASLAGEALPYTKEQLGTIGQHCTTVLQELRDSKAQHMKQRADQKAQRTIERGRMRHLNDKQLERVTKVEARSGQAPTEELQHEFQRRCADDKFPLICAAVAFVEAPYDKSDWSEIRKKLIEHMAIRPEMAVSVLNLAIQMAAGWDPVLYEEKVISLDPPHFQCKAISTRKLGIGSGSSKKAAKQQAVLQLLGVLGQVEGTGSFNLKAPEKAPVPLVIPKQDGRDPISVLQELAQARQSAPVYTFNMTGTSNAPTFTSRCEFFGVAADGKASSKQEAKRNAARAVLRALSEAHDSDLRSRDPADQDGSVNLPGGSDPA